MAIDNYSSNVLTEVVNSLQRQPVALLDNFFPTPIVEDSEEIHFDIENDVMGIAPFVSPFVEGQLLSEVGFRTSTFKPAYIKVKRNFDAPGSQKRLIGERLGGEYSPEERMRMRILQHLEYDRMAIDRRLEWMASSVLRTGAVTISGDKYPSVTVSFGRDVGLTKTLSGGNRWGQAGISPMDNLQTWATEIFQKSGSEARNVVMDVAAWTIFRNDATVKERLATQRRLGEMPTLDQGAVISTGITFKGEIDGFNIWVYVGQYKDDAGNLQTILPANTVLMIGDIGGRQHYGAIQDVSILRAVPIYTKSWEEQDPSARLVMSQSAPLVYFTRPNASACITVN